MSAETLRQKQSRFALMAARLILQAQAMGYEVTLGEAHRSPAEAARLAAAAAVERMPGDIAVAAEAEAIAALAGR